MVSHDRYLLDETVRAIAEVDARPGAHVAGQLLALPRRARARAAAAAGGRGAAQQKEIARLEDAIRRYKQWASMVDDPRHTTRARNTQRRIDRMDKVERPVLERRKIALQLRSGVRGGKRVAEWRDVTVAFGADPVLIGVDLTVFRGERIGVIGDNGSGKSVLVKLLAGELEPIEGEMWVGPSIEVGFLPQEHAPAPARQTPVDALRAQKPCTEEEAVSALLRFLFTYEQCRQQVNDALRRRADAARAAAADARGANCLVLDEPTNHLDIDSVEMLEAAIEAFDGTVVFVSHDRYFLDRIADRIVEVRDGGATASEGGYSTWYARRRAA